jgi:CRISPR/Cas system CMR subunit Cmr4 (Cas7 group RAMP superfamily)
LLITVEDEAIKKKKKIMITNDEGRVMKEKFKIKDDKIRETTGELLVFWSDIQKEQKILKKENKKKKKEEKTKRRNNNT